MSRFVDERMGIDLGGGCRLIEEIVGHPDVKVRGRASPVRLRPGLFISPNGPVSVSPIEHGIHVVSFRHVRAVVARVNRDDAIDPPVLVGIKLHRGIVSLFRDVIVVSISDDARGIVGGISVIGFADVGRPKGLLGLARLVNRGDLVMEAAFAKGTLLVERGYRFPISRFFRGAIQGDFEIRESLLSERGIGELDGQNEQIQITRRGENVTLQGQRHVAKRKREHVLGVQIR